MLRSILASPNVASKEWVIRQYDHEVQGGSVLKPLQGIHSDGPGDGVAFTPRFGSPRGIVIGCGMNPLYGDLDPCRMALSALDEAVRNVTAAGGDPGRTAVLDNFCWGNVECPETLGSLVEAARGCHRAAVELGVPFISGKDSLTNEFRTAETTLSVPPSLLISSLAVTDDVRRLVSMDLKTPGSRLILVGLTRDELGGSHLLRCLERTGGEVPGLFRQARAIHHAVHGAISAGLVLSCHDLSEGGLAVAAAEMAFSGDIVVEMSLAKVVRDLVRNEESEEAPQGPGATDLTLLFSESNSRYLIEARPDDVPRLMQCFADVPAAVFGETLEYHILRVTGLEGNTVLAESLEDLKEAWQAPLRFCAAAR